VKKCIGGIPLGVPNLKYFKGVVCHVRDNDKGVWIETQYLPINKCNELKNTLGSWFYEIK